MTISQNLVLWTIIAITNAAWATPAFLTFQGRLFDNNGAPLDSGVSEVTLQILSPNECLLREEVHSFDFQGTNGYFSTAIGLGALSSDSPNFLYSSIFDNSLTFSDPKLNCTGDSYTPNTTDHRLLRVIVGGEALSPDQTINAVPYATHAAKLAGKTLSDIEADYQNYADQYLAGSVLPDLQASPLTAGDSFRWDGTKWSVFQAAPADLPSNSVTLDDVSFASSDGISLPQLAAAPSSPVNGQVYYNTTSNKMLVYNGSGWVETGSSPWAAQGSDITFTAGNVGIGTTTPTAGLEVHSNNTLTFLGADRSHVNRIQSTTPDDSGAKFSFVGGDLEVVRSDDDLSPVWGSAIRLINFSDLHSPHFVGQRARGTTSTPSYLLENDPIVAFRGVANPTMPGASNQMEVSFSADEDHSDTAAGSRLTFTTVQKGSLGGVERMRIDSLGNIGVGTTTPNTKLHVVHDRTGGAVYPLIVEDSVHGNATTLFAGLPGIGFNYLHDGTDPKVFSADEYASEINMTPTDGKIHFKIWEKQAAANSATTLLSEPLTLTRDGYVGVGTTTPDRPLKVVGTSSGGAAEVMSTSTGNVYLRVSNPDAAIHMGIGASGETNDMPYIWPSTGEFFIGNDGDSKFYVNTVTGDIGMGTTNPSGPLEISRDAAASFAVTGYGSTPSERGLITLRSGRGSEASPTATQAFDGLGSVQFNGYDNDSFTTRRAGVHGYASENYTATNQGAGLYFDTTDNGSTTVTERMRILPNGNVGVGITAPDHKLDVNGDIEFTNGQGSRFYSTRADSDYDLIQSGSSTKRALSIHPSASGSDVFSAYAHNGTGYAPAFHVKNTTGNVGVGTTSPAQELHLEGGDTVNFQITRSGVNKVLLGDIGGDNDGGLILYDSSGTLKTVIRSDNNSYIQGGNVGIGTTAPTYNLHVVGSAGKTTGTAWTNISDRRLKDINGKYEHGLEQILKLQTVRYRYKENNQMSLPSDEEVIGFVAQDVQQVIPEAVSKRDDGYLELNVDPIHWASVNAIQELNAKCEQSQDQMGQHDEKIEQLEAGNKMLKEDSQRLLAENQALRAENQLIRSWICKKDPEAEICR